MKRRRAVGLPEEVGPRIAPAAFGADFDLIVLAPAGRRRIALDGRRDVAGGETHPLGVVDEPVTRPWALADQVPSGAAASWATSCSRLEPERRTTRSRLELSASVGFLVWLVLASNVVVS
jgi:hypothetical protein